MVETFTIKPLEWFRHEPDNAVYADTLFGSFRVTEYPAGSFVADYGGKSIPPWAQRCDSIEAGKLKAEQHYLEQLKTVLSPCQNSDRVLQD